MLILSTHDSSSKGDAGIGQFCADCHLPQEVIIIASTVMKEFSNRRADQTTALFVIRIELTYE